MKPVRLLSAAEQVAAHLRDEVLRGGLGERLPGVHQLAAELGVNHKTVAGAIRLLEKECLLEPQGTGRSRRVLSPRGFKPPALRVGILAVEPADCGLNYMVELRHELAEAGHTVFFAPKFLYDLRMDVRRVSRVVDRNPADAWLVLGGSRELLEWFAARGSPVFALFGRRRGLPIASAGPDKSTALVEAMHDLARLGHRRIVLLTRRMRRVPVPGAFEQAFLDELTRHGIDPSPYHLPDWEENIDGFHALLEELFRVTPPTALIVDEVPFFLAVRQFLAERGMRVPRDVSMICTDASPDFEWCRPRISHIRWDSRPLVRRVVRWISNVAGGREDRKHTFTPAEFVRGETIGPAGQRRGTSV
ncbi:MAG TPA: substrate-binding domain-containing protein [Luteolibacter sp.]|nr:substrate-binding domain-containing protein [Luteolibacter sp.]